MRSGTLTFGFFLASTLLPYAWASQPKCYFPNGSLTSFSTTLTYEVCNNLAGAESQCCATTQGCSANGLCVGVQQQRTRGGCTDPTFQSPFCLSICTDALASGSSTGAAEVHQCADKSWCCGNANTTASCCANGQGVAIAMTLGVDRGDSGKMGSTVKVAIGAGVAAAVLVSLAIVGFLSWRKRKQRKIIEKQRTAILSPTRSDHGLLPFYESEKVTRPKAAMLSGTGLREENAGVERHDL